MNPVDLERIKKYLTPKALCVILQYHRRPTSDDIDVTDDMDALVDEVETLRADLAAARAVLEPFAALPSSDGPYISAGDGVKQSFFVRTGDIRNARALLSRFGTGEGKK